MNDKIERWDRWDTRLPNPKDQQRAIDLFQRSGAQTKSDFVRARIQDFFLLWNKLNRSMTMVLALRLILFQSRKKS